MLCLVSCRLSQIRLALFAFIKYNKLMSSKANRGRKACQKAHNNREWVIISRRHSDCCTWCPANAGENLRGSHSRWGRKRAIKRWYATGKGRNGRLDYVNRKFNSYANNCYWDRGITEDIYTVNPKKGRPCFCL